MLYIENLKILPEVLELINECGKFSGYQINTEKFFHPYTLKTNNQQEK